MKTAQHKYLALLALIFSVEFLYLAIAPHNRSDWALENALVLIFIIILGWSYKRFPLSNTSYSLIFVFMCLHEIGSHYTYSLVPYDHFFTVNLGFSLNEVMGWERNHFDRLLHFLFGLLLVYPVGEVYRGIAGAKGLWAYFFPLEFVMAASMLYEVIEWAAAELFGGDLGVAYLGTQGDVWDAQKDMVLATSGALLTLCFTLCITLLVLKKSLK
jgi:putative membrane protein